MWESPLLFLGLVIMDKPEEICDIQISGWGPCFHKEEDFKRIRDWIDHLSPPRPDDGYPIGGQLEELIWEIELEYNGDISLYCDQWVGVSVTGILFKSHKDPNSGKDYSRKWTYKVWVESDTFLGGVAGAYAFLKWKQAEIDEGLLN
jgi:hypothetical protein